MHRSPSRSPSLLGRTLAFAALASLAAACGGPATAAPAPVSAASAAPAPAAEDPCPAAIWQSGQTQGGACLEAAELGEERTKACATRLEQAGWRVDAQAAALIGERTGKALSCWRAPAP
jgi:hypothetical protein